MIERRTQIVSGQELFTPEPIEPVYPFVTLLTLGLLKLYRLTMKRDRVYLVDVGFNDVFVYDRESVGHRNMVFWKLNLDGAPELESVSVLRNPQAAITIKGIPSFDPEFGQRGGWVKIDYQLLVKLAVTRDYAGTIHNTTSPLTTIENAALRAARQILPFTPYREALIATVEQQIEERIASDPKVQATGLQIESVDVEGIESSKKLDEQLQSSFDRMMHAQDRRQIALQFASMDRNVFQQMLEAEEPVAALEFRSRAASQMVEAMLSSGLNPLQAYMATGQVVRDMGQPDSLAHQVAAETFKQIKEEDWPLLKIPHTKSHQERLQWERQVALQRVPAQLQESNGQHDTFTFVFETGDKVDIIWTAADTRPKVYINGEEQTARYIVLSPGVYDYMKTTVWDLYGETRRLLGV